MIRPERSVLDEYKEWTILLLVVTVVIGAVFASAWEPDTPASAPQPAPAESNITVIELTPTPTPEPTLSKEQMMEMTGGLPMGEWVTVTRENVTGLQDMSLHVSVWGWKEFTTVQWWSVLWGKYYREGAGENDKFLFVFVSSYSDQNMSTMWGIQPSQFYLDINGKMYSPSNRIPPEIRVKELDEVYNQWHVEGIKPYGYTRTYNDQNEEVAEEIGFLKSGQSQGWDGYILYTVPRETRIEDVKVHVNMHDLSDPHWWQLK